MSVKRELTYRIPLKMMCQASACQAMIISAADHITPNIYVNYETLHVHGETLSVMVITIYAQVQICDHIHVAMQKAIADALAVYSESTETVQVSDKGVMIRDFKVKDIVNA
jgi:hypothetical protein